MTVDKQEAFLLAQLNRKRELKQKYLYQTEDTEQRSSVFRSEAVKLRDLCGVLEEQPDGLNFRALLQKERQLLQQLCEEEHAAYDRMPMAWKVGSCGKSVRDRLILAGGAVKSVERAILSPDRSVRTGLLLEAAYLLEHADEALQ